MHKNSRRRNILYFSTTDREKLLSINGKKKKQTTTKMVHTCSCWTYVLWSRQKVLPYHSQACCYYRDECGSTGGSRSFAHPDRFYAICEQHLLQFVSASVGPHRIPPFLKCKCKTRKKYRALYCQQKQYSTIHTTSNGSAPGPQWLEWFSPTINW